MSVNTYLEMLFHAFRDEGMNTGDFDEFARHRTPEAQAFVSSIESEDADKADLLAASLYHDPYGVRRDYFEQETGLRLPRRGSSKESIKRFLIRQKRSLHTPSVRPPKMEKS